MREKNVASSELFRCEGQGATAKRKAQQWGHCQADERRVWGGEGWRSPLHRGDDAPRQLSCGGNGSNA